MKELKVRLCDDEKEPRFITNEKDYVKKLGIIELFDYEEGTKFVTYEDDYPITVVYIENGVLKFEDDSGDYTDYRPCITKEWLSVKFILKIEYDNIINN